GLELVNSVLRRCGCRRDGLHLALDGLQPASQFQRRCLLLGVAISEQLDIANQLGDLLLRHGDGTGLDLEVVTRRGQCVLELVASFRQISQPLLDGRDRGLVDDVIEECVQIAESDIPKLRENAGHVHLSLCVCFWAQSDDEELPPLSDDDEPESYLPPLSDDELELKLPPESSDDEEDENDPSSSSFEREGRDDSRS